MLGAYDICTHTWSVCTGETLAKTEAKQIERQKANRKKHGKALMCMEYPPLEIVEIQC